MWCIQDKFAAHENKKMVSNEENKKSGTDREKGLSIAAVQKPKQCSGFLEMIKF